MVTLEETTTLGEMTLEELLRQHVICWDEILGNPFDPDTDAMDREEIVWAEIRRRMTDENLENAAG